TPRHFRRPGGGAADNNPRRPDFRMNSVELDRMEFLLCREQDALRTGNLRGPCCRNLAYYQSGKLFCADCKKYRGHIPTKVIAALSALSNIYPKIRTCVLRGNGDKG